MEPRTHSSPATLRGMFSPSPRGSSRARVTLALARVGLLLALPGLFGFEWAAEADRLTREYESASTERRREIVRQLPSVNSEGARELLVRALEDPDETVRAEAATIVGRMRAVEAADTLEEWLTEGDVRTRVAAARALGELGRREATPALIRALGDATASVRVAAIEALSALGGDDVLAPILGRLDDTESSVRVAAAEGLSALGDPRAVVPLIGRAGDDSADARRAAYAALGELRDERALSVLVLGMQDSVEDVRLMACLALGQLRSTRAIGPLRAALSQPDVRLRVAALEALTPIEGAAASEAILDALVGVSGTRATAMSALGRRAELRVDPDLSLRFVDRLDDARGPHVTSLAIGLAEVAAAQPDRRVIPALLQLLSREQAGAAPALLALARIGGDRALVAISAELQRGEGRHQAAALGALEAFFDLHGPDGRAADALLAAIPTAENAHQVRMIELLGRTGVARAAPTLRPLLTHPEADLRRAALTALGRIGISEESENLWPLLDDDDARTRYEAAMAIGEGGREEDLRRLASDLLRAGARDRHARVAALARAARKSELPDEAENALRELAGSADRALAAHALMVLGICRSESSGAFLRELAERHRGPLGRQALELLGEREDPRSLDILRDALRGGVGRRAAAAAAGLGRPGAVAQLGPEDLRLLTESLDAPWPIPVAAGHALARLAARESGIQVDRDALQEALCRALGRRDAHLRANALVGLRALDHARCEGAVDVSRYLTPDHRVAVRVAAAAFLASEARAHPERRDAWRREAARCTREELDETVFAICRDASGGAESADADADSDAPSSAPSEEEPLLVQLYASAEASPQNLLRDRWVALRDERGLTYVGFASLHGQVYLGDSGLGGRRLELPESLPLEP